MVVLRCLLDFLSIGEKHIRPFSPFPGVQVFADEPDKSRDVFKAFQRRLNRSLHHC